MLQDRCLFICYSKQQNFRKPKYAAYATFLIWSSKDFCNFEFFRIKILSQTLYWKVSILASTPILVIYNTKIQEYEKEFNSSHYSVEIIEECVQSTKTFEANFIHFYSSLMSFILPSIILIFAYSKIIIFLANNRTSSVS